MEKIVRPGQRGVGDVSEKRREEERRGKESRAQYTQQVPTARTHSTYVPPVAYYVHHTVSTELLTPLCGQPAYGYHCVHVIPVNMKYGRTHTYHVMSCHVTSCHVILFYSIL